jgi:glycosyltransferase involved in cell wall biosynthesis
LDIKLLISLNGLSKVSSLYSNNIEEICEIVQKILQNDEYAKQISDKQIKVAVEMFSVEQNINLWKDFLNSL